MLSKKLVASLLDGALQDHPTYIGGQFRGYYIIIEPDYQTRSQRIDICAYSDSDPGNARLSEFLHQIKPEFGALNHAYVQPYSCSILLTAGVNKKLVELADPLIRRIADYLAANGYQSGCMLCGASHPDCYTINGRSMWLCSSCLESVRADLEVNKENVRAHKSNLLHGFAGAVIGALAGGIAYVLLSKVGYVASITGFLMAFLALLLYEKFGGCLDVKGIICCAVILIATVYFATRTAWSWEAYDALKDYGWSFGEVYSQLSSILKQSDLTGSFIKDLAMGYLFTAVGAVGKFINAFRNSTGKYSIKKNQ